MDSDLTNNQMPTGKSWHRKEWVNLILFGTVILVLGAGALLLNGNLSKDSKKEGQKKSNPEKALTPLAIDKTLVYGFWANGKSEIAALDLATDKSFYIASLPLNVKHVKVLSHDEIIYIADTDSNDYGSKLIVKKIPNGDERTMVTASTGVRIDDYRVSRNGEFVATWEVAKPIGSDQLFDGTSRVYLVNTLTGVKKNIFDEKANKPVHYPVAVTNDGRVFMDTFLPNDGAGWAYGMSVSDSSGENVTTIQSMSNGTYSSQPVMSSDGTRLLFTGYDGQKGDGAEVVKGVRRSILTANTIEFLQLDTLTRTKLPNMSNESIYSAVKWDETTGNIIFASASIDSSLNGTYLYDVKNSQAELKIKGQLKTLGFVNSSVALAGYTAREEGSLGNLGESYGATITTVKLVDTESENEKILNPAGALIQFITIKPTSYFGGNLQDLAKSGAEKPLKLDTFTLKTELSPKRQNQQSTKKTTPEIPGANNGTYCRELTVAYCNELLGTNYPSDILAKNGNVVPEIDFLNCYNAFLADGSLGACADSPLYLYGSEGMELIVKVGTPIFNVNAPYDPLRGFRGKLTGYGGIDISNQVFESLAFDYEPGIRFEKPVKGMIIEKKNLEQELNRYAEKLGMNEKETADFISFVILKSTSDQIFISHFPNKISQKILPLYFDPKPDNYHNIVFYLENLETKPQVSYELPSFEKIKRNGFTAVEISFVVR